MVHILCTSEDGSEALSASHLRAMATGPVPYRMTDTTREGVGSAEYLRWAYSLPEPIFIFVGKLLQSILLRAIVEFTPNILLVHLTTSSIMRLHTPPCTVCTVRQRS